MFVFDFLYNFCLKYFSFEGNINEYGKKYTLVF